MESGKSFEYQLLDRLKTDCEYFLGAGKGYENHLWANSVSAQIEKMKELFNGFSSDEKPEWISMEDILAYEKQMNVLKNVNEHLHQLQIGNIEYDGDGYFHFTIIADDYQLEGLYRIYDLKNGESLKLVSIDYGYLHPEISQNWNDIEITMAEYASIYQKELFEEACKSMQHNQEIITLYIKYNEPVNFNGISVGSDTITFGSHEELYKYISGEVAYNILDDSVKKGENEILLYAENDHGEVVWGQKEEQELINGDNGIMTIDNHEYKIVDEWQHGTASFVLGRDTNSDMEWYIVRTKETLEGFEGTYTQEYDRFPSREMIESTHDNMLSAIAIDRHEAEYGSDGSRVFHNLNTPSPEERISEIGKKEDIAPERETKIVTNEHVEEQSIQKFQRENFIRKRGR